MPQEIVENKIYLIRGYRVMLDKDLARPYGVETRVLNQAVKRNAKRFPEDFMFYLTRDEIKRMSQIVTSLKFYKRVTVFTEQGVAMLSGVLNSDRAIQVNIAIMRAFVKLRQIISTHKELVHKLEELERKIEKHDVDIQSIFGAIRQLMAPPPEKPRRMIGFRQE
ncbi:MAG: ORF6N domain-containing protein [Candidatus Omnitrophica bacterium]|nr:ORF6N domain-containing protein [Candidatus Omnitrophota bacterium]